MSWNYRIMKRESDEFFTIYGIHEVYYNDDDTVKCWTQHDIRMQSFFDTREHDNEISDATMREDLKKISKMIIVAWDRPTLDFLTGKEIP